MVGRRDRLGRKRKWGQRFHFETMWAQELKCQDIVRRSWGGARNLVENIQECSEVLGEWHQLKFGDISKKVNDCKKELDRLQRGPQIVECVQAARALENQIAALLRKE